MTCVAVPAAAVNVVSVTAETKPHARRTTARTVVTTKMVTGKRTAEGTRMLFSFLELGLWKTMMIYVKKKNNLIQLRRGTERL